MEEALVTFEEAEHFAHKYAEFYVNYGGGYVNVPPEADLYYQGMIFGNRHFIYIYVFECH